MAKVIDFNDTKDAIVEAVSNPDGVSTKKIVKKETQAPDAAGPIELSPPSTQSVSEILPVEVTPVQIMLDGEVNLDRRVDLTERAFLQEIDKLEGLRDDSEDKESLTINKAKLLLELEKVQLKRRKDMMETVINWNHLLALSQYFVKKLYAAITEVRIEPEIEDQLLEFFNKSVENWEEDIIKEGILETINKAKQKAKQAAEE